MGTKGIDYDLFYKTLRKEIKVLSDGEHKTFFDNGQLKYLFSLKNNKLHGIAKEYYKSGQLKFEGQYNNGNREGMHKEYFGDNVLESEMNFKNDSILGSFKFFYKNGMMKYETNHTKEGRDIIGYSKIYTLKRNRKKKFRNKKTGKVRIVQYPDTIYLSQSSETKNYKLHGESKSYNKKGRLTSLETHKNNTLIKRILYYEDGTSKIEEYN